MELIISIAALIFAMLTFYLQFHSAGQESQQRLINLFRSLMGSAGRIASYGLVLLIFVLSAAGIYVFWTSDEPIRRGEVVVVIFHVLNSLMYGYLTFAMPAREFRREQPVEPSEV